MWNFICISLSEIHFVVNDIRKVELVGFILGALLYFEILQYDWNEEYFLKLHVCHRESLGSIIIITDYYVEQNYFSGNGLC